MLILPKQVCSSNTFKKNRSQITGGSKWYPVCGTVKTHRQCAGSAYVPSSAALVGKDCLMRSQVSWLHTLAAPWTSPVNLERLYECFSLQGTFVVGQKLLSRYTVQSTFSKNSSQKSVKVTENVTRYCILTSTDVRGKISWARFSSLCTQKGITVCTSNESYGFLKFITMNGIRHSAFGFVSSFVI